MALIYMLSHLFLLALVVTVILLVNCFDIIVASLLLGVVYLFVILVFLINGLEFLALATYIIYLGAVIVLFIFVLMMIQVGYNRASSELLSGHYLIEMSVFLSILALPAILSLLTPIGFAPVFVRAADVFGSSTHTLVVELGFLLFQHFFLGTAWLAVILTLTLLCLLLALAYRRNTKFV